MPPGKPNHVRGNAKRKCINVTEYWDMKPKTFANIYILRIGRQGTQHRNVCLGGFPGGPVVKNLPCSAGDAIEELRFHMPRSS